MNTPEELIAAVGKMYDIEIIDGGKVLTINKPSYIYIPLQGLEITTLGHNWDLRTEGATISLWSKILMVHITIF